MQRFIQHIQQNILIVQLIHQTLCMGSRGGSESVNRKTVDQFMHWFSYDLIITIFGCHRLPDYPISMSLIDFLCHPYPAAMVPAVAQRCRQPLEAHFVI